MLARPVPGWKRARGGSILPQRFFFDLRRGSAVLRDCDGTALVDEAAARTFAVINARALISADVAEGVIDLDQEIVIYDGRRRQLDTVAFGETVLIVKAGSAGSRDR